MDWLVQFTDIVFRQPYRLYAIPPVALVFGVLFAWKYRDAVRVMKRPWYDMHERRVPSLSRYAARGILFVVLAGLLVCVLTEPEWRFVEREPVYGRVRITFLFDSSPSMRFAEDIAPNRLEAARAVVAELVRALWTDPALKGNYVLSLIPFAGGAIPLYLPFTTARESFLEYLRVIDEKTVTTAGTSVYAALRGLDQLLFKYPAWGKGTVDVVILLSDGGKEEGIEVPRNKIAALIKELPGVVRIYTVGIGSREVDAACAARFMHERTRASKEEVALLCARPVPVALLARQDDGSARYLRMNPNDPKSSILVSTLDEDTLTFIAEKGGGAYTFFENRVVLLSIFRDIVLRNRVVESWIERPYYRPAAEVFLIPAFILAYFLSGFGGWISTGARSLRKFFCGFTHEGRRRTITRETRKRGST
ncbi:MAG: VWA domain-containing protein [bacterium]|nr:VWA domain-containing protein [bacterium]MDZ4284768.1 VWA domain-containing protein [Patescibacteria group bacterium]